MIRYVIEKYVESSYGHGYTLIMDGDKPRTFTSDKEAFDWLMENDPEFPLIPIIKLHSYYHIKQHVI